MKKTALLRTLSLILAFITVVMLLAACGEKQNPLVGTWKVESIDGSAKAYRVGSEVTFRDNGKVYDTDDFLSYKFNEEYPVTSWDTVSSSSLILSGLFGDTVKISYSISGKTLTLRDSYGSAVLKKQ